MSSTGPNGTTTYTHNGRGALAQVAGPSCSALYTNDSLDRLTQLTMPNGAQVQYVYDVDGRLLRRVDASSRPTPDRASGAVDDSRTLNRHVYAAGDSTNKEDRADELYSASVRVTPRRRFSASLPCVAASRHSPLQNVRPAPQFQRDREPGGPH